MKKPTAKKTASKLTKTTSTNRREAGSRSARGAAAKPKKPNLKATTTGSAGKPKNKTELVDQMLRSPLGATREELSKATKWPTVNLTVAAGRRPDHDLVEDEATGKVRLVPKKAEKIAS